MNKSNLHKISVIIPVYNTEKYLAEAIQSVLKQEEKPLEVLVVDDCSTDGSVKVAEKFTDKVTLIKRDSNKGCGAARNLGIKHATGDILAFFHTTISGQMINLLPRSTHAGTSRNPIYQYQDSVFS